MSTSVRLAALLSATIVLSACGAPEVPERMPFAEPGVEFEITPVDRNCTPDGAYVARVSWEVPQSMGSKIEVQVGADERKVFTRSNEAIGSEETGQWTSEGMVFVLTERDSGMVLAAKQAGAGNCGG